MGLGFDGSTWGNRSVGATLRVEKSPFVHVVVRLLLLRKALSNDSRGVFMFNERKHEERLLGSLGKPHQSVTGQLVVSRVFEFKKSRSYLTENSREKTRA